MSHDRRPTGILHPRLTVVSTTASDRESVLSALAPWTRSVTRSELLQSATASAERRRLAEGEGLAGLEDEVRACESRQRTAQAELDDLQADQRELRSAANWCGAQPEADTADTEEIQSNIVTVDDQSRHVREVNRKLERVIEQRAAAEAALEEAHRELLDLGHAEFDETDVRRGMEAASRDLADASTRYQEAMAESERRRATVSRFEAAIAARDAADQAPTEPADQFLAMRAAVEAKFAAKDPDADVTPAQLEAARAAAREAAEAAAAAERNHATARRRVESFENELTVRSRDGNSLISRRDAAEELERQVREVEHRLAEAEEKAQAEVDEANRRLSRLELNLERLRNSARERQRRLESLAEKLSPEAGLSGTDLLEHVDVLSEGLRQRADEMQTEIDESSARVERIQGEVETLREELNRRRAGQTSVVGADRSEALRSLLDPGVPVVLDGLVAVDEPRPLIVGDLRDLGGESPVIVVTDDTELVGWAIELPGDEGAVLLPSAIAAASPDPVRR